MIFRSLIPLFLLSFHYIVDIHAEQSKARPESNKMKCPHIFSASNRNEVLCEAEAGFNDVVKENIS